MTSSSSAKAPTTLYDVLGVAAEATTEEIKKRYRALAIRYHPDKLVGLSTDSEAANAHFAAITEAYKVLSDDRQRRWYDAHAVERLSAAEIEESHLDEAYFTSACYSGFEEDGKWSSKSFYTVYGSLFERIVELEQRFNEHFDYPQFGGSGAELAAVKRFYDVWQSFSTGFTFSHLEGLFDTKSAANTSRQVLRLAKKENAKLVEKARKERNGRVRRLVALLRKVDPRMRQYQRGLEKKAAQNRLKSEQHRLRQLAETRKALDEWQSASDKQQQQQSGGWLDMSAIEEELEKLDNGDEDEEDQGDDEEDEEEDEEEEEEVYFCADCNRLFKTENTLKSHQKSKKHLAAAMKQRQKQKKEVVDDEDDDDDEVEDEEDE